MALPPDLLSSVFMHSFMYSRRYFCFEILYLLQFSLNSTANSFPYSSFYVQFQPIIFLRISSRPKCIKEFLNFRIFFYSFIYFDWVHALQILKQETFLFLYRKRPEKIIDSIKSSIETNIVRKRSLCFIGNWIVNVRSSVMEKSIFDLFIHCFYGDISNKAQRFLSNQ